MAQIFFPTDGRQNAVALEDDSITLASTDTLLVDQAGVAFNVPLTTLFNTPSGVDILAEGGIGYDDGGTVTQATSITTGVTLSAHSGQITTVSSTLAAGAEATFTVTNTNVAATDVVVVCLASTSSAGTPQAHCTAVAAGSFDITINNLHASAALDNTMVINFAVFKGSSS